MIHSMTGFGRATGQVLERETSVEIRTVNGRFKEVSVRMPRLFSPLEEAVKAMTNGLVQRGRTDVTIQFQETATKDKALKVDVELARTYHRLFMEMKEALGLEGGVTVADMIGVKDVITYSTEEPDLEAAQEQLLPLVGEALERLVEMRRTEGASLAADMTARIDIIEGLVEGVAERREAVVAEFRTRMENRIAVLLDGQDPDPARLAQEVAILIDRADVTEEVVRLRSHLDQFRTILDSEGTVGRRLEFLLQEMGRETNTIGSKSTDLEITNRVLEMKTELEKIREQVQNVE